VVQAPVQVEILRGLTLLARSGRLMQKSKVVGGNPSACHLEPKKVVHVGHSYGSFTTFGLLASYGGLSDGAILTGFVFNDQISKIGVNVFGWEFAAENDPQRFGDRSSGYLVQGTETSAQLIFFNKATLEAELLRYASQIKQTATTAELLSGSTILGQPAMNFRGPVQVSHMQHFCYAAMLFRDMHGWRTQKC
jgi:pimeloyl-ACP methyl ester carboxylesterase